MVSRLKNNFILEDLQSVPAGYDFLSFSIHVLLL